MSQALHHSALTLGFRGSQVVKARGAAVASPPAPAACAKKHAFRCQAVNPKAAEALRALKPTAPKVAVVDPMYTAASDYLKQIGILNMAEVNRILDIATNPNSLFLDSKNANARPLDVQKDMKPVVDFLFDKKVTDGDIIKIVSGHPPVLSYTVEQLEKLWQYLESVGITDVASVIVKRPNLLGLDVDKNLRKIVEYLQYVETPPETIVKYLSESI